MVAIVTASILPYTYTIPHNSPPSSLSLPPAVAILPPYSPSAVLTIPHPPSLIPCAAIRHRPPLAPLVGSRRFSLLTLCGPYSIPSPLLLFPDITSADIKLRYQLPRRQTTARSPAMNLRVEARVLCSLSVDGVNIGSAVRAREVNARVHARPRRLIRDNRRAVIWHAIREKPVTPIILYLSHIYFALIESLSFGNKFFARSCRMTSKTTLSFCGIIRYIKRFLEFHEN